MTRAPVRMRMWSRVAAGRRGSWRGSWRWARRASRRLAGAPAPLLRVLAARVNALALAGGVAAVCVGVSQVYGPAAWIVGGAMAIWLVLAGRTEAGKGDPR